MPKAERTEVFEIDINKFYQTLIDYESYPEFVDGVSSIKVLNKTEKGATVEYSLNLIKKFKYILKMEHQKPNRVSWKFDSGDIFKTNEGFWEISEGGKGKIKVTYNISIEVKGFAPSIIVDKLVAHNLPQMMASYYNEARGRV